MASAVDGFITFDGVRYEYALRDRARESSPPAIRFCPWCGALLYRVRAKREVVRATSTPKKRGAKRKRSAGA